MCGILAIVLEPSARMLRLLGLLQVGTEWPGAELADRLAVTVRTLGRDVQRLRDLDYPVHSVPGVAGVTGLARARRCRLCCLTTTRRSPSPLAGAAPPPTRRPAGPGRRGAAGPG